MKSKKSGWYLSWSVYLAESGFKGLPGGQDIIREEPVSLCWWSWGFSTRDLPSFQWSPWWGLDLLEVICITITHKYIWIKRTIYHFLLNKLMFGIFISQLKYIQLRWGFVAVVCFLRQVSLCGPGWLGTHY